MLVLFFVLHYTLWQEPLISIWILIRCNNVAQSVKARAKERANEIRMKKKECKKKLLKIDNIQFIISQISCLSLFCGLEKNVSRYKDRQRSSNKQMRKIITQLSPTSTFFDNMRMNWQRIKFLNRTFVTIFFRVWIFFVEFRFFCRYPTFTVQIEHRNNNKEKTVHRYWIEWIFNNS